MSIHQILLCGLILASINLNLHAQSAEDLDHQFQSEVYEGERKIRVHLPKRYAEDSTQEFLVTYVLDAQSDHFWDMAKSNISYLVNNHQILPMIVVGIVSDNRGSEFSPKNPELTEHLIKEVFPWVESNYRVNQFRTIIGHSWGGAFVGNTLFSEHADLFDAYIGVSPSLDAYDWMILNQADSILQINQNLPKFFYCTAGTVGIREAESLECLKRAGEIFEKHPNESLVWKPVIFEDKDHWSCVIPSINDGLVQMSRNYFVDQYMMEEMVRNSDQSLQAQVETFNTQQFEKYGYVYKPGFRYLRFVANDFRNLEDYETALVIYDWALELQPDDLRVWMNVADVHDKMEDIPKAKEAMNKTIALLEVEKENISEKFYNNVKEWAEEKLESYNE